MIGEDATVDAVNPRVSKALLSAGAARAALNYWGWLVVVMGVMMGYARLFPEDRPGSRLPALLLLPQYLVSVAWAIERRPVYLLYSGLFPLVMYLGPKEER